MTDERETLWRDSSRLHLEMHDLVKRAAGIHARAKAILDATPSAFDDGPHSIGDQLDMHVDGQRLWDVDAMNAWNLAARAMKVAQLAVTRANSDVASATSVAKAPPEE